MKTKNDLVTVIIPTHGRVDTLERAIKSVERQTYNNIEIIVVDDNPNSIIRDEVESIVKEHGVRLIKNATQMGGGKTRNIGISNAKGDFIAFLDDDDEMRPEKIEKQIKLFKENDDGRVGLIYCYADYIYPEKVETRRIDFEGLPLKEHLITCIAATSWWFCSKKALEDVGGFADVPNHQDAMTLFKLLKAGYKIYRVPEVLLDYYAPDGKGITRTSNEWIDTDRLYMKMYLEISDRFSKKDNKDIQYSFYKRMASYDFILNNKKELYLETYRMAKIYLFKKDTMKAMAKCGLSIFKGGHSVTH